MKKATTLDKDERELARSLTRNTRAIALINKSGSTKAKYPLIVNRQDIVD